MSILTARRPSTKPQLLVIAAVLGLFVSMAAMTLGPVPKAAAADPATPGWYMIVSDYYDGSSSSHGDGKMRCLSTNGQDSTSGSGTHAVYLAVCNPDTPGQWWRLLSVDGWDQMRNLQQWGGVNWCLSGNQSTPGGAFSDTHGAYTSGCRSATLGQYWKWYKVASPNSWNIQHYLNWSSTLTQWLNTTELVPNAGNTYQVFTSSDSYEPVWRLYAPESPPACSTCGL